MSAIFSVYHKPKLLFSYFFVETNLRGCQVNTVFTAKKLVSRGRGGGWNPSLEFLICYSISKRFSLEWKVYFTGGDATGGL